jgi:predicted DNA-binding mobile mystery protein A
MTATALAQRLAMTSAGLRKLESSEAHERISLATLRKVADALDCDLRYALVPRQPLEDKLMARARSVVAEQMGPVAHSMALEDQKVDDKEAMDKYLDSAARSLIRRSPRSLW